MPSRALNVPGDQPYLAHHVPARLLLPCSKLSRHSRSGQRLFQRLRKPILLKKLNYFAEIAPVFFLSPPTPRSQLPAWRDLLQTFQRALTFIASNTSIERTALGIVIIPLRASIWRRELCLSSDSPERSMPAIISQECLELGGARDEHCLPVSEWMQEKERDSIEGGKEDRSNESKGTGFGLGVLSAEKIRLTRERRTFSLAILITGSVDRLCHLVLCAR